jgi:O-antigen/teichoic acid export membrane protein
MFPGFSKLREVERIAQAYLKLFGLITATILPIGIGIAAVAAPLVVTALGDKWLAAIPVIQLLAIHGAISATQGNNGVVWLALGHPRKLTGFAALFVAILFPAVYVFMKAYGTIGVGFAYLLAHAVTVPYSMLITKRLLKFSWATFVGTLWRPLIGVVAMYVAVYYLDIMLSTQPALLRLVCDSLAGALVYTAVLLLAWRAAGSPDGAEQFVLARVTKSWSSLQRRFT